VDAGCVNGTETDPAIMLAATVIAPGRIEMQRVAVPEPGPKQVRVRLEGCGVCASNLPPWEGRPWFNYPMPAGDLGHEGWGRIDALGNEVNDFAVGDRVAMLSTNAYAQYTIASAEALLALPAGRTSDLPFPGEPLACAMNIFSRSGIGKGDTVAILGIGFLGALLTQLATEAGAKVIAISRRSYSLQIAEQCGAWKTMLLDEKLSMVKEVLDATGGKLCNVTIEATGHQVPLDLAGELTRERGRLIIAGYHQDGPCLVNLQLWNWRGLDVINAHERDPAIYLKGMKLALEAVLNGNLDPSRLYTHHFQLFQLSEALAITARRPPGFVKALILFQ